MTLGIWVDDPGHLVKSDTYFERLRELHVREIALMVDSSIPGFKPCYSREDLEGILTLARRFDISAVATIWPECDRAKIDFMMPRLEELLSLGFVALENDVEGNWKTRLVHGFTSLDDAAVYLTSREREICEKYDVRLEMTTHTGHREAGPQAFMARLVDRVYYQLYSTESDWQGKPVAWGGPRGPGRLQAEFIEDVIENVPEFVKGTVKLCAGLPFWDQKWPGHTVEEALGLAFSAISNLGIFEVRGWSSKWVVGHLSKSTDQLAVSAWLKAF